MNPIEQNYFGRNTGGLAVIKDGKAIFWDDILRILNEIIPGYTPGTFHEDFYSPDRIAQERIRRVILGVQKEVQKDERFGKTAILCMLEVEGGMWTSHYFHIVEVPAPEKRTKKNAAGRAAHSNRTRRAATRAA